MSFRDWRWTVAVVAAAAGIAACGAGPSAPSPTPSAGSVAAVCAGVPGQVCSGTNGYVTYEPGSLPIVISVPHGGSLAPSSIPDRTAGTSVTDLNTIELGRAIAEAFRQQTGAAPHVIYVHLRRTKLDANRDVVEAAQGQPDAARAWTEYHVFIDQATAAAAGGGTGLYIDLHGHGHAIPRLELGYLLTAATLDQDDAALDQGGFGAVSSLARLLPGASVPFSALLRGPTSLGGLLAPRVPSVPSPDAPSPGGEPYFDGGYRTGRHTATVAGLQIETHYSGIRDSAASRAAFGSTLAEAVLRFLEIHAG